MRRKCWIFSRTLAFRDFELERNAAEYRHANIDVPVRLEEVDESMDFFTLFDFSAKWDPVPTMLTQNHVSSVKGFLRSDNGLPQRNHQKCCGHTG